MDQIRQGSFVEVKSSARLSDAFQGKVGQVTRLLEWKGKFALVLFDGRSHVFSLDDLVLKVWCQ